MKIVISITDRRALYAAAVIDLRSMAIHSRRSSPFVSTSFILHSSPISTDHGMHGTIGVVARLAEVAIGEDQRGHQRPGVEGQTHPGGGDLHPHRGCVVRQRTQVGVWPGEVKRFVNVIIF